MQHHHLDGAYLPVGVLGVCTLPVGMYPPWGVNLGFFVMHSTGGGEGWEVWGGGGKWGKMKCSYYSYELNPAFNQRL